MKVENTVLVKSSRGGGGAIEREVLYYFRLNSDAALYILSVCVCMHACVLVDANYGRVKERKTERYTCIAEQEEILDRIILTEVVNKNEKADD